MIRRWTQGFVLAAWLVLAACHEKPETYEGTWEGGDPSGYHVAKIVISQKDFPCKGTVTTQYGSGQIFLMDVDWDKQGDDLVGTLASGDKDRMATVRLVGKTLAGHVSSLVTVAGKRDLTFTGFRKK